MGECWYWTAIKHYRQVNNMLHDREEALYEFIRLPGFISFHFLSLLTYYTATNFYNHQQIMEAHHIFHKLYEARLNICSWSQSVSKHFVRGTVFHWSRLYLIKKCALTDSPYLRLEICLPLGKMKISPSYFVQNRWKFVYIDWYSKCLKLGKGHLYRAAQT